MRGIALNAVTVQNTIIVVDTALFGVRSFNNGVQCWITGNGTNGANNFKNAFYTIDLFGNESVDNNGKII